MIIKTLSRKTGAKGLLNYLFEKEEKIKSNNQSPLVLKHNIRSRTLGNWIMEFDKNETYRLLNRKDSVRMYHSILSFSNKDKDKIGAKTLKDIGRKFIELRGLNNIYVGTVHYDKEHVHLHMAHSGIEYMTGKASRQSKAQFQELKLAMDAYQKEKYPELINSLPRHGKSKERLLGKEKPTTRLNERETIKKALLQTLNQAFGKSKSLDDFLSTLKAQGHEPYYRSGRLTGVKFEGDRKYRLNRLGFDKEKIDELDQNRQKEEATLKELRELRESRSPGRNKDNDKDGQENENRDTNKDNDDRDDIER